MRLPAACLTLLLLAGLAAGKDAPTRPAYPATPRGEASDTLHGQVIPDPYRWMERDEAPEVVAWDVAQNELLRAHLDSFPRRAALEQRLDEELALGGMRSLPTFRGGRRWFTMRPKGGNHEVLYVTDEEGLEEPRVVIDPHTWSAEQTSSMKAWITSPDGAHVAFRRDDEGSEETTLHVLRVADGTVLPDRITRTKFASVVWTDDGQGFFYNRMPDPESVPEGEAQYHDRVYHHRLGRLPVDDPIVWGQGRPALENCWIYRSSDEQHVFVGRGMPYREVETFEVQGQDERATFVPLVVGEATRTWVDRTGDTYVFNTDRNTGNREVFLAQRSPEGDVGPWEKVPFPVGESGVIKECWPVAGTHLLCHAKQDVVSHLYVAPLVGTGMREVPLPGPGTVGDVALKPGDPRVWFTFQSYSRPLTRYRCDLAAPELKIVEEEVVPTTVDVARLVSTQTHYASKDGTQVPIFLLHAQGTKLDGSAPTVLYGYGGFRVGLYPYFSRARALWAELGGVFAVACLRGGDEYGEAWHEAGSLGTKQNVFDDFIAAADWLVASGQAARCNLAIQGGSNGGLLVATCINQRPDLAAAVVCGVPLTDMLRYHRFQYAKSWSKEYGDPDVAEEFAWIRPYSPYHNVVPAAYPAVLVTAGIKDGRVNAFHARKIVARWQEASTSQAPVLLRIDRKGGHGAANVKRAYEEVLDEWCFVLQALRAPR